MGVEPGYVALPFGLQARPEMHAVVVRQMPRVIRQLHAFTDLLEAAFENEDIMLVELTMNEISVLAGILGKVMPTVYPARIHETDAARMEWAAEQGARVESAVRGVLTRLEEEEQDEGSAGGASDIGAELERMIREADRG